MPKPPKSAKQGPPAWRSEKWPHVCIIADDDDDGEKKDYGWKKKMSDGWKKDDGWRKDDGWKKQDEWKAKDDGWKKDEWKENDDGWKDGWKDGGKEKDDGWKKDGKKEQDDGRKKNDEEEGAWGQWTIDGKAWHGPWAVQEPSSGSVGDSWSKSISQTMEGNGWTAQLGSSMFSLRIVELQTVSLYTRNSNSLCLRGFHHMLASSTHRPNLCAPFQESRDALEHGCAQHGLQCGQCF